VLLDIESYITSENETSIKHCVDFSCIGPHGVFVAGLCVGFAFVVESLYA
jgi:hypothetical protein